MIHYYFWRLKINQCAVKSKFITDTKMKVSNFEIENFSVVNFIKTNYCRLNNYLFLTKNICQWFYQISVTAV